MGICQTRGIEPVQPFHQGSFQFEKNLENFQEETILKFHSNLEFQTQITSFPFFTLIFVLPSTLVSLLSLSDRYLTVKLF